MTSAVHVALNVVAGLQPALALMKHIWDEVEKVEINRVQCDGLARRADRILITIHRCLEESPYNPSDMDEHLQRLQRNLEFVATLIRNIANLSFLKSLLARDHIRTRIDEAHNRLADTLVGFQITAAVELRKHQEEDRQARIADAERMQQRLKQLSHNDTELIRAFQIERNQMLEAMLAMQNNLIRNAENCVERQFLQTALASFQRLTKQTAPERIPSWLITSFDIDIDNDTLLGAGSFGTVKRALWKGIAVAVKVMSLETDQNLLLREIKIWKNLRHDHIVPFYGASIVANPPFIVCRFMRHGSLVRYLRESVHADRIKLAHEIALGMLYLHDNHIVHGDLKTANILVDDSEQACITDFGLSKIQYDARSRTASNAAASKPVGTLRFMAPQQLRGQMSKAGDVYSYSMTLYEVFVGEVPFSTVPDHPLFEIICREGQRLTRPISIEVLNRGLTDSIWDLIWRCSDHVSDLRPTFHTIAQKTEEIRNSWRPVNISTPTLPVVQVTDLFAGLDLGVDDTNTHLPAEAIDVPLPDKNSRAPTPSISENATESTRREALVDWCNAMNAYLTKHAKEHKQTLEGVLNGWRQYYGNFFTAIEPHFAKLNEHLKLLPSQQFNIVDYQCNSLWAGVVVRDFPGAKPYALDYGTPIISSWLKRFGGIATRITPSDPVLKEPFDASLWWTPAPVTLEHYTLHSTLLRKGGILLGAVNLRDWTEEEYSQDVREPPGFRMLANWVDFVSYPSAQDKTPYKFFALQSIST